MSEWQLIETAPRDGTLIRVGWKFPNDTEMQEWFTMQWGHIQRNPIFAPDAVGMWVMPDGSMTWYEDTEAGPTHWMPIPTGDA
jgi:hypothetical protein